MRSLCAARKGSEFLSLIEALLAELEQTPIDAAIKYGKLSGRCCSCGLELTDPQRIAAGIGPICARKFA